MTGSDSSAPVPTLADVAARAGVSTATVSRCLNAPDQVGEKTRARVLEAVEAMGYAPNFGAQALAAKQTNTVGVVIPTMENAVFARGIQAFQEELGRYGKTLLIASSSYQPELEAAQIRSLVARGADAVLLIGYDRAPAVYGFLETQKVPVLVSWAYDPAQPQAAIGFDNQAAMAALAREALALGHRHVACISAPVATNDRARGRVEGIRQALAEAGQDPGALHLVETAYGIAEGEAALREIREQAPETTLVMCGNDVLALGALRGAREMRVRVPWDVSITGFDDIEIAQLAEPALTTVHVPHREMGARAAQMLVSALREKILPPGVLLQTELRLRGTLGPAP